MKRANGSGAAVRTIFCMLAILAVVCVARLGAQSNQAPAKQGEDMQRHASGSFDIKLTPAPADEKGAPALGRLTFDKEIHGDLEGSSHGQSLTASTGVKGSAAYVAIELISGTLQGRKGSFVLQHRGVMRAGAQESSITVVPDSGTDQLTGISGSFKIRMENGKHFYEFDYRLPDSAR